MEKIKIKSLLKANDLSILNTELTKLKDKKIINIEAYPLTADLLQDPQIVNEYILYSTRQKYNGLFSKPSIEAIYTIAGTALEFHEYFQAAEFLLDNFFILEITYEEARPYVVYLEKNTENNTMSATIENLNK